MRKTQEQVQQEREERKQTQKELKAQEYEERIELEINQQHERRILKAKQAARRKDSATTAAGGKREGAGRKPSMLHKPFIHNGQDLNVKKTYTFYGSQDEKEPVKRFLRVWREIRFTLTDQEQAALLEGISGLTVYQLMTGNRITNKKDFEKLSEKLPKIARVAKGKVLFE